LTLIHCSN